MADDWAWPALIQSLQRDIEHLRGAVDDMRRETSHARERHREELDGLIDQLREVRSELDPILTEREASKAAKREMVWGWVGKGGWLVLLGTAAAVWHWITNHAER
jgi:hypothetical protein